MNKFAKYVPEEDKKKQREHIGAAGSIADLCEKVGKVSLMHEQLGFSWHADDGVNSIVEYTSTFGMFEEGKVYDVVLDGTRYEGLVAYYNDDEEYVAIGAEEYNDEEGIINSEYPFIFMNDDADESLLRFIVPRKEDQNIPYDIEILAEGVVITTIDPKYLPVMTVNMTEGTPCMMTCDKTFDEVYAHLINGGTVIGIYKYSSKEHVLMTVSGWRDNAVRFIGTMTSVYATDENSEGVVEYISHYVVNIGKNGYNTWAKHRVVG